MDADLVMDATGKNGGWQFDNPRHQHGSRVHCVNVPFWLYDYMTYLNRGRRSGRGFFGLSESLEGSCRGFRQMYALRSTFKVRAGEPILAQHGSRVNCCGVTGVHRVHSDGVLGRRVGLDGYPMDRIGGMCLYTYDKRSIICMEVTLNGNQAAIEWLSR